MVHACREPGGAVKLRVSGGAKCARSQGGADRPRWNEGIRGRRRSYRILSLQGIMGIDEGLQETS